MLVCSVDAFVVEAHSVGDLHQLRIRHDNAGTAAGWFIDKVTVKDMETKQVFHFPCNQWLAKDEGDGSIERLLNVEGDFNELTSDCIDASLKSIVNSCPTVR